MTIAGSSKHYYRQTATKSSPSYRRWFFAGEPTAGTSSAYTLAQDSLWALPLVCPGGGTADAFAFYQANNVTGGKVSLGLYSNGLDGNNIPANRVWNKDNVDVSAGSPFINGAFNLSVPLTAGALYWLVYWCNFSSISIRAINGTLCWPINGFDDDFGSAGTGMQIGWKAVYGFTQFAGAMPAVFPYDLTTSGEPGTNLQILNSNVASVPLLGCHLSSY